MKTISLYISIFTIAVVASLSSCALKKDEFAQRKYYNFPRAKHIMEKNETEHVSIKPNIKITTELFTVQEKKTT